MPYDATRSGRGQGLSEDQERLLTSLEKQHIGQYERGQLQALAMYATGGDEERVQRLLGNRPTGGDGQQRREMATPEGREQYNDWLRESKGKCPTCGHELKGAS